MTFYHVAVDQRSVTGIEFFRHAVLALEFGKGFAEENFLFDYEAIFLQMADPAIATVSGRRLVDGYRRRRRFRLRLYDPGGAELQNQGKRQ
jgi:hypothetical protein